MFSDPQFWVALAFFVFVLSIFNPIRKILVLSLDTKINEIKKNIEEAENLKNETQLTLSKIKKRQNDVESEIFSIHSNAKEKIKILEREAQSKLKEQITKRQLIAEAKISQMTREANLSIQKNISQTAIETVVIILEKKLDEKIKENLINQSIKETSIVIKN